MIIRFKTKIRPYTHTRTHAHSVQGIEISKSDNLRCYVGVHNMGIKALGNRIYITMLTLVKKTGNVCINVTMRQVRRTIVAVEKR